MAIKPQLCQKGLTGLKMKRSCNQKERKKYTHKNTKNNKTYRHITLLLVRWVQGHHKYQSRKA